MTDKLYTQSEVDALIQAANEAVYKEFFEPLKLANSMLLDLAVKVLPEEGEGCEEYHDLRGHLLGLTVMAEITQPSALARHDAELRTEFQDEIQALNEQIVQMKAEFAAVMEKIERTVAALGGPETQQNWRVAIETAVNHIHALIPTDYASALDRRLAEVREEEHKNHVQFASDLYCTLIDPLADGSIPEEEVFRKVREAAVQHRQQINDIPERERQARLEEADVIRNEHKRREEGSFILWFVNHLAELRRAVKGERE